MDFFTTNFQSIDENQRALTTFLSGFFCLGLIMYTKTRQGWTREITRSNQQQIKCWNSWHLGRVAQPVQNSTEKVTLICQAVCPRFWMYLLCLFYQKGIAFWSLLKTRFRMSDSDNYTLLHYVFFYSPKYKANTFERLSIKECILNFESSSYES